MGRRQLKKANGGRWIFSINLLNHISEISKMSDEWTLSVHLQKGCINCNDKTSVRLVSLLRMKPAEVLQL